MNDKFDIQSFLLRVLRNWYWVVISVAITLAAAWGYLLHTPNVYKIDSTLLIKERKNSGLSQEVIIQELGFRGNRNLINELQILKSRSMMEQVVAALQLNIRYYTEERFNTKEFYPVAPITLSYVEPIEAAYGKQFTILPIDTLSFQVVQIKEEEQYDTTLHYYNIPFSLQHTSYSITYNYPFDQAIDLNVKNPRQLAQSYANQLSIVPIKKSDVLSIAMTDEIPQRAMDIINQLVKVYNNSMVEDKKMVAAKTLTFIDDRLKYITAELLQVEKKVEQFKTTGDIPTVLSDNANQLLQRITTGDKTISEIDLQKTMLQNIQTHLANTTEDIFDFLATSKEISGSPVSSLVSKYNELVVEKKTMLASIHPNDPRVQLLNTQLYELRANILKAIKISSEELEVRKEEVTKQLDPIVARLSRIPRDERELLQIMRQQQIKESLFLFLLKKREETALSQSAQMADSKVIDAPAVKGLVSPSRPRIYALFFLLGLALPLGILYLKERTDDLIYSKKELKTITNIPFLGMLGQTKEQEKIVVKPGVRTSIAEMFHLLRTNLNYLLPLNGSPCRIVLLTSSASGEGKTFTTINLGVSLALSGAKTLLIGMDMRKPRLATYIQGKKTARGVSNFLAGVEQDVESMIYPVEEIDNLFFLSAGPIPPNPADLLGNERMNDLFDTLKQQFDFILIDTPPIGLVTDAYLVSKYVKASILVTRFKVTTKAQVQHFEELHQEKKLPNPAIVLNGVVNTKNYGYGYRYGYGYGYYEAKKKRWWHIKLPV